MYCATSFCEREHSSKRARMYFDRLWCSLVPPTGGWRSLVGVATRFIGALVRRRRLSLLPRSRDLAAGGDPPCPAAAYIQRPDVRLGSQQAERAMRIAIVGAGVSGLVAAHLLHREHEIVVYEASSYAGGHTNTIRVDTGYETHHVDTGFIVMNDRNYPLFTRLLDRLGVARQATHMSFSVKGEEHDFEFSGTPRGLFCQPGNIASPRFQRMIARPAALQPRAAPPARARGERRVDARLPRAPQLLARFHRAADRAADVGRLVGRPAAGRLVSGALHRRVLRQSRNARLSRPATLVDRLRRLGALRRGAHRAVPRPHPPRRAGQLDHAQRRGGRADRRRLPAPSATTM